MILSECFLTNFIIKGTRNEFKCAYRFKARGQASKLMIQAFTKFFHQKDMLDIPYFNYYIMTLIYFIFMCVFND